jgi:hypothetical protein
MSFDSSAGGAGISFGASLSAAELAFNAAWRWYSWPVLVGVGKELDQLE